jgi:hypothetical protein
MQMNITEEAPTQTEQTEIQQMEAVSVGLTETVAEITSITATTMELTDEENGGYYTCTKA